MLPSRTPVKILPQRPAVSNPGQRIGQRVLLHLSPFGTALKDEVPLFALDLQHADAEQIGPREAEDRNQQVGQLVFPPYQGGVERKEAADTAGCQRQEEGPAGKRRVVKQNGQKERNIKQQEDAWKNRVDHRQNQCGRDKGIGKNPRLQARASGFCRRSR